VVEHLAEGPLRAPAASPRECREVLPRPETAPSEAPNPAQSLLPRMSVAAILDDAMGAFTLPVDGRLRMAWRRLVELVNQLDVMVDGMESGRQQQLLLGVATIAEDGSVADLDPSLRVDAVAVKAFAEACAVLDLEMPCRQAWSAHFKSLVFEHSVGHRISDIDEYFLHRCQTGSLLGLMFADLVPLRDRSGAFGRMVDWVGPLGACAELVDSFWDLPEDYRQGHSAVAPTLRNRVRLARAARGRAPAVFEPIPPKLRAKLAAKVFLMGANRSGRLNRFRTAD
jgi:hypothetical protein